MSEDDQTPPLLGARQRMLERQAQTASAIADASVLGHLVYFTGWVWEEGDRWTLCCRCGGLAQINEDGTYRGPALTDRCSGVQGGYARPAGAKGTST